MRISVVGLLVLGACTPAPPDDGSAAPSDGPAPPPALERPADSLVGPDTVHLAIPEPPRARAERLVTAAVSTREDIDASGVWRAEATLCQGPPVVQLVALEPLFSAIVLFAPPEGGEAAGVYDVSEGDVNLPDSATARVGVQVHPEGERPAAFAGVRGTVEIQRLDSTLVGHLAVVAVDARYYDTVFLSGAFDLPVANASEAACRVMGEPLH